MKFINWPCRCAEVKGHFVQTISLDLTKSSEVRKAGDQPKYVIQKQYFYFLQICTSTIIFFFTFIYNGFGVVQSDPPRCFI